MDPWGSDPYDSELAAAMATVPLQQQQILAKQRRAQMLMAAPTPQGMQIGRTFVASSPLEHLATAMMRIKGGQLNREADQAYGPLIQAQQAGAEQAARLQRFDVNRKFGLEATKEAREGRTADAKIEHDRGTLAETGRHNLATEGLGREEYGLRLGQFGETQRHNRSLEGIENRKLDQNKYTFPVDPITGGIAVANKDTGQVTFGLGTPGGGPGTVTPKPKDLEEDVQKLGKDMEPLSKARSDINLLRVAADKGNVEGFGPVAGRMPNLVTGDEGVANRQAAGRLMAAIIQATSGQAASEKEVERLLEANGMGRTATDAQFRQGIQKLDAQYQSLTREREAKYHPDVVNVYRTRGGYGSGRVSAPEDLRKKYGL